MSKQIVEQNYLGKINQILESNNLKLYELNWVFEYETDVLQILVVNKDESIKNVEFDALVKSNEAISAMLDEDTLLKNAYVLEVSSAGAERQVKDKETLLNNIGSYFYIKSNLGIENIYEFNATLKSYDKESDEFVFEFFIKGRPKKAKLKFDDISFIRFAIKF
ncbi:ribosome maturation factor RimP [Spiroplasma helicoides]|uniref:Ribosome maturation factor RimP n=1 Tax=Spiroplasma helicoides TaxID=216938 RepID=A0A1B3SL36_9MOLU|nr:hypothetical protein [Spiroplasma helicoides]AOG60630.1 ribosome maturation factor RimP [Spiroplasma helicoides]